jgi:anti-sigma B factor antagonist
MAGAFGVEESGDHRAHVMAVAGDLDAASAAAFKERLLAGLDRAEPLILDLGEVTYMDSTAVAALFAARKETGVSRSRCAVVCNGEIRRMFDFTGLDLVFEVVESRAAALASVVAIA